MKKIFIGKHLSNVELRTKNKNTLQIVDMQGIDNVVS
jgi:hypothetical protein